LFVIGSLVMAYNLWRTMRGDLRLEASPSRSAEPAPAMGAAS
jgi:cbb3-type cytochrome oxidase subunit 1